MLGRLAQVLGNANARRVMTKKAQQVIDGHPIEVPFGFGRVSDARLAEHNRIQLLTGRDFVGSPNVVVHPNAHNTHVRKRFYENPALTGDDYSRWAFDAVHGPDTVLAASHNRDGLQNVVYQAPESRAILGQYNDGLSLKSVIPRHEKTKLLLGLQPANNNLDGYLPAQIGSNTTPRAASTRSIPKSQRIVNDRARRQSVEALKKLEMLDYESEAERRVLVDKLRG